MLSIAQRDSARRGRGDRKVPAKMTSSISCREAQREPLRARGTQAKSRRWSTYPTRWGDDRRQTAGFETRRGVVAKDLKPFNVKT